MSYKTILVLLKFLPFLLALTHMIGTFCWIYNINTILLSYIGGVSLLPILFIYLASYVFKFCAYHRMFLHYVVLDTFLSTLDYYFDIGFGPTPYLLLIGITIILVTYLHIKEKNESNIKKTS